MSPREQGGPEEQDSMRRDVLVEDLENQCWSLKSKH